jgi:hypothetical protein
MIAQAIAVYDGPACKWTTWCESLWREAEGAWLARSGQDHFYRRSVVVPALTTAMRRHTRFGTMLDVGCGDGYTTQLVLRELHAAGDGPRSVCLIDRSTSQLEVASRRQLLTGAGIVSANLASGDWHGRIAALRRGPTVIISTFVVQELPSLSGLLGGLASLLRAGDVALLLFVAPSYSAHLLDHQQIERVALSDGQVDWRWAGKYPISIGANVVYLPHFQRDLALIGAACQAHGLAVSACNTLSVPDTPQAREVFSSSVYGADIIGRPSSVLLSVSRPA